MVAHTVCLSQSFLEKEFENTEQQSLIPISGICHVCNIDLKWGRLIHAMKTRKPQHFDKKEIVENLDSSEDSLELVQDDIVINSNELVGDVDVSELVQDIIIINDRCRQLSITK